MTDLENLRQTIVNINHSIRDAEWNRDITYMQNTLDDSLLFRRANGSLADKKTYLEGLSDLSNSYDYLQNVSLEVAIHDNGVFATATVTVKASGKRGKDQKPFNGVFKNIRFFKKGSDWRLYAWYNEAI